MTLTVEQKIELWDAVHDYARKSYSGKQMPVGRPGRELAVIELERLIESFMARAVECAANQTVGEALVEGEGRVAGKHGDQDIGAALTRAVIAGYSPSLRVANGLWVCRLSDDPSALLAGFASLEQAADWLDGYTMP